MKYETVKQKWHGISLITSAIAMVTATFFMADQEFTAIGGIIMMLTVPFSIIGFGGIFEKFRYDMPLYASWGPHALSFWCSGHCKFWSARSVW